MKQNPAARQPQAILICPTSRAEILASIHASLRGVLQATRNAHWLPAGMTAELYLHHRREYIVAMADGLRRDLRELRRTGYAVPAHWHTWIPRPCDQGMMIPGDKPADANYVWRLANEADVAEFEVDIQLAIDAMAGRAAGSGETNVATSTPEEWSKPRTLSEFSKTLKLDSTDKVKTALKPYGLKTTAGNRQAWIVRLDTMPGNYRKLLGE